MRPEDALDILDRLRDHAGSDADAALDADDVAAARSVVESDPELARIHERRRAFDHRVHDVLDDVTIPEGLHGRLLDTLGLAAAPTTVREETPAKVGRRRTLQVAMAVAVTGIAVGLGVWWAIHTTTPAPRLHDYHLAAVNEFDTVGGLPAFEGRYTPRLPDSGWDQGRTLRVESEPRRLTVGGDASRTVAAYRFEVHDPHTPGDPSRGVLLAVPTAWLADAPAAEYIERSGTSYTGRYASMAWRERETTFICVVDDPTTLDAIVRALDVRAA